MISGIFAPWTFQEERVSFVESSQQAGVIVELPSQDDQLMRKFVRHFPRYQQL